jgi:hypothetical protein
MTTMAVVSGARRRARDGVFIGWLLNVAAEAMH